MRFDYIIDKINQTQIQHEPFKHIEINNLFSVEDFKEIISSPEIKLSKAIDDNNLFELLFNNGYRIIEFPGSITEHQKYIEWHKKKDLAHITNTSCEGYGVVLRLTKETSNTLEELSAFLKSSSFVNCIADKFNISSSKCDYDAGIQKYLDGYEISPHPDIRRKALTFMVNINPDPLSESKDHHTHYMIFNPNRYYVQAFWAGNPKEVQTCWIPWNWCRTIKQQTKNNSIVIFSPSSDTLHAVKASYDHLTFQRTQLYGNLWYKETPTLTKWHWENLDLLKYNHTETIQASLLNTVKGLIPAPVKNTLRKVISRSNKKKTSTHANRFSSR